MYFLFKTPCKCMRRHRQLKNALNGCGFVIGSVTIMYSAYFIVINTNVENIVFSGSKSKKQFIIVDFLTKQVYSTIVDFLVFQNLKAFFWTCYAHCCGKAG